MLMKIGRKQSTTSPTTTSTSTMSSGSSDGDAKKDDSKDSKAETSDIKVDIKDPTEDKAGLGLGFFSSDDDEKKKKEEEDNSGVNSTIVNQAFQLVKWTGLPHHVRILITIIPSIPFHLIIFMTI
jgi:hypothetical protein